MLTLAGEWADARPGRTGGGDAFGIELCETQVFSRTRPRPLFTRNVGKPCVFLIIVIITSAGGYTQHEEKRNRAYAERDGKEREGYCDGGHHGKERDEQGVCHWFVFKAIERIHVVAKDGKRRDDRDDDAHQQLANDIDVLRCGNIGGREVDLEDDKRDGRDGERDACGHAQPSVACNRGVAERVGGELDADGHCIERCRCDSCPAAERLSNFPLIGDNFADRSANQGSNIEHRAKRKGLQQANGNRLGGRDSELGKRCSKRVHLRSFLKVVEYGSDEADLATWRAGFAGHFAAMAAGRSWRDSNGAS